MDLLLRLDVGAISVTVFVKLISHLSGWGRSSFNNVTPNQNMCRPGSWFHIPISHARLLLFGS